MTTNNSSILFEDLFDVRVKNPDGKKFDKVDRIQCKGVAYETDLVIDINTDAYPIFEGEKISFALARTLSLDGRPDTGEFDQSGKPTLLDKYEYGMYGKVFKYEHEREHRVAVYVSFGGLLMCLKGDQRHLVNVDLDSNIYCLIRKTLRR